MRRKLNVKLVGIILGSVLFAAVVVHFWHGFQVQRNAHRLLERADRAADAKEDDKALFYYAQYMTLNPGDVDARQKYVLVLDRQESADRVPLILLMQEVLRAKPGEHELRMRLVFNLIALERFAEALTDLKRLDGKWSDQAELLHLIGWCQDAQKNYAEAARAFEAAVRLKPAQVKTYVLLAEVLQDRLHRPDEAQKWLDELVRRNGASYQAYLVRARFSRRRGDDKAAERDIDRAYQLAPNQPEVMLEVADSARRRGDLPASIKLLEDGSRRFPEQVPFYRALAQVHASNNRPGDAIGVLEAGLKQSPRSLDLIVNLIDLLIDQDRRREAQVKLDEARQLSMKAGLASYFRARLAFADGRWQETIQLLDRAQQDRSVGGEWTSRMHALAGLSHRQLEQHEEELHEFRKTVQQDPGWLRGNVELGAALVNCKLFEEAGQALEPLKNARDLPASYWTLLSRTRLEGQLKLKEKDRRWDGVEEALTRAERAEPRSALPLVIRAEMLTARRDETGARRLIERAAALDPHYARQALQRAEKSLVPLRDYRDALWLARLAGAAGDPNKAEQFLQHVLAEAGHIPDVWIAWMEHLQQTGQRERGVKELERLKAELSPARRPLTLARCYEALAMPTEAHQAYQSALALAPDDFVTLAFAADFARRTGRVDEAIRLYERLLDPALAAPAEYTTPARGHLANLQATSQKR